MVTTTRRLTLEELERTGGPEGRWELIDGEVVEMPPAGGKHSFVGVRMSWFIADFVYEHQLGFVFGADGGFILREEPLLLRVPDVAFVRTERLPANFDNGGFLRVAPDLVVEILSPSDRITEVLAKIVMWLEAGVALLWLVDPAAETVTVYRPGELPQTLTREQTLDGGDVLPGFTLAVSAIFAV
jgi:Uma2 family endonuclease